MNLESRSFAGKTFRPRPEILLNSDLNLFAIATPWGPGFQTKNVLEFLSQSCGAFSSDEEATSVIPRLKCLTPEENTLRSMALACNERIFKEQNEAKEYTFGYELVCGLFSGDFDSGPGAGKILFVQAGHPSIYLDRAGFSLQPLGHVLDLSGGFSRLEEKLPPLPSRLLGIHEDAHFSVFSLPVKRGDRLVFISRAAVPGALLEAPREQRNLQDLSLLLAEDDENMAFWLSILDFQKTA